MQHYLKEIKENTNNLSTEALNHIAVCSKCQAELKTMKRIEYAIASIPEQAMPYILKQTIFQNLKIPQIRPIFQIWSYILPIFMFLFTPLIISYLKQQNFVAISQNWFLFLSSFFTVWGVMLIIALGAQISQQYQTFIEKLQKSLDYMLMHVKPKS